MLARRPQTAQAAAHAEYRSQKLVAMCKCGPQILMFDRTTGTFEGADTVTVTADSLAIILGLVSIVLGILSAGLAVFALVWSWVVFKHTMRLQERANEVLSSACSKLDLVARHTSRQVTHAIDALAGKDVYTNLRATSESSPQEKAVGMSDVDEIRATLFRGAKSEVMSYANLVHARDTGTNEFVSIREFADFVQGDDEPDTLDNDLRAVADASKALSEGKLSGSELDKALSLAQGLAAFLRTIVERPESPQAETPEGVS